MVRGAGARDRRSNDPKSSVRAPAKKDGGGGHYTLGRLGDTSGGATIDRDDPNYDPDERRVDPDDGVAYKYDELAAFYRGKFTAQAIAEYWDYECTPAPRKKRTKAEKQQPAGPSLEESAALAAKPKAKAKAKAKPVSRLTVEELESDGPLAQEVAQVIPYYPFKKVEKFYDVQGLLRHPNLFNAVCDVMATRFQKKAVTKLAAFEARGFLFTPVALKVNLPFVMLRKKGKIPSGTGSDAICVQRGMIEAGDKVVLIDDLLASGGTLSAAIEVIKGCKAEVAECCCMLEIKSQGGREKCTEAGAKNVWSFISEDLLTNKAVLPKDYVDDGHS